MTDKQNSKVVVLGISGPTRSGKSELANHLGSYFQLPSSLILHQDKFWKPPHSRPVIPHTNKKNMESPDSVDWKSLCSALIKAQKSAQRDGYPLVIVEGFLLFTNFSVVELLNLKIFLTIPKHTCFERRSATKWAHPNEFNNLIWPEYVKHNQKVLSRFLKQKEEKTKIDFVVLDGKDRIDNIFNMALAFVVGKPVKSKEKLFCQHLEDDAPLEILPSDKQSKRWQPDLGSAAGHVRTDRKKRTREFDKDDNRENKKCARYV